jgi:hypothetical protein
MTKVLNNEKRIENILFLIILFTFVMLSLIYNLSSTAKVSVLLFFFIFNGFIFSVFSKNSKKF